MKANNANVKKSVNNAKARNAASGEQVVEVLYQRMGDRWFAFSLIGEEVFVGSLTTDEIHAAESGVTRAQKVYKVSGNS